jgi:hypothetical protein
MYHSISMTPVGEVTGAGRLPFNCWLISLLVCTHESVGQLDTVTQSVEGKGSVYRGWNERVSSQFKAPFGATMAAMTAPFKFKFPSLRRLKVPVGHVNFCLRLDNEAPAQLTSEKDGIESNNRGQDSQTPI